MEDNQQPPVTPKNFTVRYKASVERAFKNAGVKFPWTRDENWEKLMDSLSVEANKLLDNFQPAYHPSPGKGDKDAALAALAALLEERGVRRYLNINNCGYSQVERDIVSLLQPPSPEQEGMRWRDDDPEEHGEYFCEIEHEEDEGETEKDVITWMSQWENMAPGWRVVRWLDESSPSSPGMREALEKIATLSTSGIGTKGKYIEALQDIARKALTQSPAEVEGESGVRMFEAFDSVNKRVTDRTVYMDQEGDLYEDQDPHGVDMSGTRRIKSTIRYTLYQSKNK
jgi:hypothetical protein